MTHSWTTLLTDKSPIESIFGEERPSLSNIDLHEIIIHRDGPKVTLVFDLDSYPKSPPKKWVVGEFNKVQIKLSAFSVQELSINQFHTKNITSLDIFQDGEFICLTTNKEPSLKILAEYLVLDKISAYYDLGKF